MIQLDAVVTLFADLEANELRSWVERRWVRPETGDEDSWLFGEVDVARVRLIYDLRRDLETPEETIPLVLSLIDQVYELRGALKAMRDALAAQPAEIRNAVHATLRAQQEG